MGQNASTPGVQDPSSSQDLFSSRRMSRRTSQLRVTPLHTSESPSVTTMSTSSTRQSHSRTPSNRHLATFTRQITSSSIGAVRGVFSQAETSGRRDAIFYEQQEERPLEHMEDLGMRNAPITNITASPLPRQSRLSRLSSLIMPRNANNERVQGHQEQEVNWQAPLTRDSLEIARRVQRHQIVRSSRHHGGPPEVSEEALRHGRTQSMPIARPVLLDADLRASPPLLARSSQDNSSRSSFVLRSATTPQSSDSTSHLSRLARIRRSILQPFEAPSFAHRVPNQVFITSRPRQRTRNLIPAHDLSSQTSSNTASANDLDRITSAIENDADRDIERLGTLSSPNVSEADSVTGRNPNWADRWTDRSIGGRRENRRISSMLSGRSTRAVRRDQDGPHPRILNLAALAIAARLVDSDAYSTHEDELHSSGPNAIDGNLQSLLQALTNTDYLASGEMAAAENEEGTGRPTIRASPRDYLRVFRFVSLATGTTSNAESANYDDSTNSNRTNEHQAARERGSQDSEDRIVTLVVIGVRSLPVEGPFREVPPASEPVVDPLLGVPSIASAPNIRSAEIGNLPEPASSAQSNPNSGRATNIRNTPFSADSDGQRHPRTSNSQGLPLADDTVLGEAATSSSLAVSDSPPGPRPPPSTPADPSILSPYASQVTTPSRRQSSASIIQQAQTSTREVAFSHIREAAEGSTMHQDQPTLRAHNRRRSESESARHRDLGAGAARRNGVVAPDEADNPAPSIARRQSWLIYVVGTSISEDHPALAAPSLFTDNPSYEDMLFLSSLLGPVRPPVASAEDVSSAGGIYRVSKTVPHLAAENMQDGAALFVSPDERCLVCLEEYHINEELRQLAKCSHVFHRACIDEWLTSGRNSCPLCRGQGVPNEKHDGDPQSTPHP